MLKLRRRRRVNIKVLNVFNVSKKDDNRCNELCMYLYGHNNRDFMFGASRIHKERNSRMLNLPVTGSEHVCSQFFRQHFLLVGQSTSTSQLYTMFSQFPESGGSSQMPGLPEHTMLEIFWMNTPLMSSLNVFCGFTY